MKRRVVVTGLGLVTAVGNDVPTTWSAVVAGVATTFGHLDAVVALDRSIAELGIYPAVDPLASTSRALTPEIVKPCEHVVTTAVINMAGMFNTAPVE